MYTLPSLCSGESIRVFVRVRPPDPALETNLDSSACLHVTTATALTVHSKPEPKVFTFDHVADMHTTQVANMHVHVLMNARTEVHMYSTYCK